MVTQKPRCRPNAWVAATAITAMAAAAPGGVCGVSFFARSDGDWEIGRSRTGVGTRDGKIGEIVQGLWLLTMEELLAFFSGWQMLEAARVWQWNPHTNRPQPFVTLIAHNAPAGDPPLPLPLLLRPTREAVRRLPPPA